VKNNTRQKENSGIERETEKLPICVKKKIRKRKKAIPYWVRLVKKAEWKQWKGWGKVTKPKREEEKKKGKKNRKKWKEIQDEGDAVLQSVDITGVGVILGGGFRGKKKATKGRNAGGRVA